MNVLKIGAKYLDQPILVKNFQKSVPYILLGSCALYTFNKSIEAPKGEKVETAIKTGVTLGGTVASALAAPKLASKIFRNPEEISQSLKSLADYQRGLIYNYMSSNALPDDIVTMLRANSGKAFSFSEFKKLSKYLSKTENGKIFLNQIVPEPENITSSEIFSKIGELSLLGFIPVVGGIFSGIIADMLTTTEWKGKIPDKIKEGAYQYLANIFLCNIGAGTALGILEKFNVKSKVSRALGMIGGIVVTGILGGSALANLIGQKIINPLLHQKNNSGNIFAERTPEPIDISLHTDDIATVAVMSGLKWIEPALPIMYSISGYRAGIGYRNNNVQYAQSLVTE